MLPDGSLLCRDVPIARTGTMLYDESELLDQNGERIGSSPDGVLRVYRDEDDLFRPETIRSFEAAPITLKHPPVWMTPQSYSEYSKGSIRNVRRGEGTLSNYLLADLVVRDQSAIDAINRGMREVSPGYDCDYEPVEGQTGHYRQKNLIGNHLAIVDRGRGGRTVRIGDSEGPVMAFKKKSWGSKLMAALQTNDADGVEEAIREGADESPETRVEPTLDRTRDEEVTPDPMAACMTAISGLGEKIDALPALIAQALKATTDEDGAGSGDEAEKDDDKEALTETEDEAEMLCDDGKRAPTGDAAFVAVRQHTLSAAEILSPGLKIVTTDSAASAKDKREAIDGMRRQALENAMRDPAKAKVISDTLGYRKLTPRTMTSDALFSTFNAASAAVKNANNLGGKGSYGGFKSFTEDRSGTSPASINERNKAFYNRKK